MTVKQPEAYISFPPLHFPVSKLTHTATCESAEFDTASLRTDTLTHSAYIHTKKAAQPTPLTRRVNEADISLKV